MFIQKPKRMKVCDSFTFPDQRSAFFCTESFAFAAEEEVDAWPASSVWQAATCIWPARCQAWASVDWWRQRGDYCAVARRRGAGLERWSLCLASSRRDCRKREASSRSEMVFWDVASHCSWAVASLEYAAVGVDAGVFDTACCYWQGR